MMSRMACLFLLALAAPAMADAQTLTSTVPFDTLVACLRERLAPQGRVTAINTAAGAMLDFAFDSVGADGRIATAHLNFSVDDRGTERSLSVAAPNPTDAALARDYLRLAGARCAGPRGAP